MKVYIRHGNSIVDKLDRIGPSLLDAESFYVETTIENMGVDFYNAIKNGSLASGQNTFTIEIVNE